MRTSRPRWLTVRPQTPRQSALPEAKEKEADQSGRLKFGTSQLIFLLYFVFFALFFLVVIHGVGQYWDWAFPYFPDQISTIFTNRSHSWSPLEGGSPLGYSSDYFLRLLLALPTFLAPELLRYILLVAIFSAGSFGVYLLAAPRTTRPVAFLLGLTALVNPAIFYKYTAGHFNYLIAYTLFIYLFYFLFSKFKKDLRSAVITGLLLAFMGVQIQFFLFGTLFLALFFFFYRKRFFSLKYALVIFALPVLINLVWLSNFLHGGAEIANTGTAAAKERFARSSSSNYLNIFTFSFSKATLLSKFYVLYELLWHTALFLILLWMLVRKQYKQMIDVLLLSFLVILMFLGTGLYQTINLGPLTAFYPMFREVGHFAPLIILTALIILCRHARRDSLRLALGVFLFGSVFIVAIKFQYFSQAINFPKVRQQFASFKQAGDNDTPTHRILAYPFFGKYSFTVFERDVKNDFPLRNAGHDSFGVYTKEEFLNNAIAPHEFKDSAQYKLLQTYNLDVLRPYNVKYLYDFSDIYESNYERYVPPKTYDNDLSLIKNDPDFFKKLEAHNPGRLRRVNDHILEIVDYTPRVFSTDELYRINQTDTPQYIDEFTQSAFHRPFDYLRDNSALKKYTSGLRIPFQHINGEVLDTQARTVSDTIELPRDRKSELFVNTTPRTVYFRREGNQLTIYAKENDTLSLDGTSLQVGQRPEETLLNTTLAPGTQYYLSFKDTLVAIPEEGEQAVGTARPDDAVELFAATDQNSIVNPSFEQGSWQKEVGDCNNYDHSAKLRMSLSQTQKSEGQQALELAATRHNACVSTEVLFTDASQYALSYDYQSPNAQTANFYLQFGDKKGFADGFQAVHGQKWKHTTSLVNKPDDTQKGRLFVYALEGDKTSETINRYDNFSLVPLEKVTRLQIPRQASTYQSVPLESGGKHTLLFHDAVNEYQNLLQNPSFERGLWHNKVSDCHNYDARAKMDMRLASSHSAGSSSLELSATRHNACTMTTVNVRGESEYLLRFDYQGEGDKPQFGYNVSFDDPSASDENEKHPIKGGDWHHFDKKIHVPQNATTMTIYVYAFESNGKDANTTRYDNFSLVALPDFTNRYYVVSRPAVHLSRPQEISFDQASVTKRLIHIKGAKEPFFLALSESYHPGWQLSMNGKALPKSLHFEMDDYLNGWYVDPASLCQQVGCQAGADGSYHLEMVAKFTPEKWMKIHLWMSSATIVASVGYLAVGTYRRRRSG